MPGLAGPNALTYEDSVTRVASPTALDTRGIYGRYDKRTVTLIDGPDAGSQVTYWVALCEIESLPGGLTGKAEDSPSASGDVGLAVLAVRNDAGGSLVNADGDYAMLQLGPTGALRSDKGVVTTAKATYTTAGDHTLVTPPAGQRLRVVWIFAQAKGALDTGVVLVTVTLGANSYDFELTGSQPFAHGAVWEAAADVLLVVTTSSTAAVIVNVDYRTF
ncbi:MAG: hypothetical protein ABIW46_08635 [Acidimicrobiales bacterium]